MNQNNSPQQTNSISWGQSLLHSQSSNNLPPPPPPQINYWAKPTIGCDQTVQLGNNDRTGTTFYAETIKNVSDSDSSGEGESSGYSGGSDEESSSSSEDGSERLSREVTNEKTAGSSDEFSKPFPVDGFYSHHHAFMAHLVGQSNQVCVDKPNASKCDKCIELKGKCLELESKYEFIKCHNQSQIGDVAKCPKVNVALKTNERVYYTIETLRKDVSELEKTALNKKNLVLITRLISLKKQR
ncbi:hypothetical protein Hanom_Chr09g00773221 [Helianthus anomalus]